MTTIFFRLYVSNEKWNEKNLTATSHHARETTPEKIMKFFFEFFSKLNSAESFFLRLLNEKEWEREIYEKREKKTLFEHFQHWKSPTHQRIDFEESYRTRGRISSSYNVRTLCMMLNEIQLRLTESWERYSRL